MNRTFLSAGILAALGCLALQAQTINVTATIPFEFQAGRYTMPAGEYSIAHSNGVLRLRCDSAANKSVMLIAMPASSEPAGTPSKLIFNRYGNQHFLARVWRNGNSNTIAVLPAKVERELAASARKGAATTTVALAAK